MASAVLLVILMTSLSMCQPISGTSLPGLKMRMTKKGLDYANSLAQTAIAKKLRALRIPDQSGSSGKKRWNVARIDNRGVTIPRSSMTFDPYRNALSWTVSGLDINLYANDWKFKYKMLFFWTYFSGRMRLNVKRASIHVTIGLGQSRGRPSVSLSRCWSSIDDVDVKVYGSIFSFIINWFRGSIGNKIRIALINQMCRVAGRLINYDLNHELALLKVKEDLGHEFLLDYSLVSSPKVYRHALDLENKGELYWKTKVEEPPFHQKPIPSLINSNTHMMYVWVTDYMATSAIHHAYKNGYFHYNVTENNFPSGEESFLDTTCSRYCVGKLIPLLGDVLPHSKIEISVKAKHSPLFTISPGGISLEGKVMLDFHIITPTQERIASFLNAELELFLSVSGSILYQRLAGEITQYRLEIKQINTALGDMDVEYDKLNTMLKAAVDLGVVPSLNAVLRLGIDLPITDVLTFKNTQLTLLNGSVLIATDVRAWVEPPTRLEIQRRLQEEQKREQEFLLHQQREELKRQEEEELKRRQEEERKRRQQEELKRREEEKLKQRQEEELKRRQEEELKQRQEEDLKRRQEEELKRRQEEELKRRQEEELKRRQEEELKRRQEDEVKRRQEEELKRRQEEEVKRQKSQEINQGQNQRSKEKEPLNKTKQKQTEQPTKQETTEQLVLTKRPKIVEKHQTLHYLATEQMLTTEEPRGIKQPQLNWHLHTTEETQINELATEKILRTENPGGNKQQHNTWKLHTAEEAQLNELTTEHNLPTEHPPGSNQTQIHQLHTTEEAEINELTTEQILTTEHPDGNKQPKINGQLHTTSELNEQMYTKEDFQMNEITEKIQPNLMSTNQVFTTEQLRGNELIYGQQHIIIQPRDKVTTQKKKQMHTTEESGGNNQSEVNEELYTTVQPNFNEQQSKIDKLLMSQVRPTEILGLKDPLLVDSEQYTTEKLQLNEMLHTAEKSQVNKQPHTLGQINQNKPLHTTEKSQTNKQLQTTEEYHVNKQLHTTAELQLDKQLQTTEEPQINVQIYTEEKPQLNTHLSITQEQQINKEKGPNINTQLQTTKEPPAYKQLYTREEKQIYKKLRTTEERQANKQLHTTEEPHVQMKPYKLETPHHLRTIEKPEVNN